MTSNDKRISYVAPFVFISVFSIYFISKNFKDTTLTILLILLAVSVGLLLIPQTIQFRKDNKELVNFFLTLITTFFGVYLAIVLTNRSTTQVEKTKVISLIKATKSDIEMAWDQVYYKFYDYRKNYDNKPDSAFKNMVKSDNKLGLVPFSKPTLPYSLLQSDLAINYLHTETIVEIASINANCDLLYQQLNNYADSDYQKFIKLGSEMTYYYVSAIAFLNQQIRFMKNEISEEEFLKSTYDINAEFHKRPSKPVFLKLIEHDTDN